MVKLLRMNGKGQTAKTYVSYTDTEIEVTRYNRLDQNAAHEDSIWGPRSLE